MDFQAVLAEMVRRIVAQCHPERVILFGSHASGRGGQGSDVDLLVIVAGSGSKRQQAVALHRVLRGLGIPKDIIVVRPEEFARYRDVVGTIIYPAAHGGRVLYEHAA